MGIAMPDVAGTYKQRKGMGYSWDEKKRKASYWKTRRLLILGTFSPAVVGVCVRIALKYHNNRFLSWVPLISYYTHFPIQNFEKIFASRSSVVMVPVISPR